jgi:hypothetical protein
MPSFADRGDWYRALEQEVAFWVRPGLGETSARRIRKLARDNLHVYDSTRICCAAPSRPSIAWGRSGPRLWWSSPRTMPRRSEE